MENVAYFECPKCGGYCSVFGESHLMETAKKLGIGCNAWLPIVQKISTACDAGTVESLDFYWLDGIAEFFLSI